jgi:hypothetical protein
MEPSKSVEAMVEPSKSVEAMVEPVAAEPVPATPRVPYSRACEEQGHQRDDDPHPLLLSSHGNPLPLIICGGAFPLAPDRVRWPFDADLLRNLPIARVKELGQTHSASVMAWHHPGPMCTTGVRAISVPPMDPARCHAPLVRYRRRQARRGTAARTAQTACDDRVRQVAEGHEPASPPRWGGTGETVPGRNRVFEDETRGQTSAGRCRSTREEIWR